jgi:hypothetical protein
MAANRRPRARRTFFTMRKSMAPYDRARDQTESSREIVLCETL